MAKREDFKVGTIFSYNWHGSKEQGASDEDKTFGIFLRFAGEEIRYILLFDLADLDFGSENCLAFDLFENHFEIIGNDE